VLQQKRKFDQEFLNCAFTMSATFKSSFDRMTIINQSITDTPATYFSSDSVVYVITNSGEFSSSISIVRLTGFSRKGASTFSSELQITTLYSHTDGISLRVSCSRRTASDDMSTGSVTFSREAKGKAS
jgi:hypothetical protein